MVGCVCEKYSKIHEEISSDPLAAIHSFHKHIVADPSKQF